MPSASPSAPPVNDSTRLSVKSWRTMRPRPGADGQSNRDFTLAAGGADQQEIRDVGARDQQHQTDRASQHQERWPNIEHDRVLKRLNGKG